MDVCSSTVRVEHHEVTSGAGECRVAARTAFGKWAHVQSIKIARRHTRIGKGTSVMYATIRRYRTTSDAAPESVRRILEDFVPLIAETVTAYYVLDTGDGVIASITICEDEEKVRMSNRVAAEWAKQQLASSIAANEELQSINLDVDDPLDGVLYEGVSEPVYKRSLQLLSVQEVGGLLGMGRSWVYQQIKAGELPSVHLGGSVKVRREDLEGYIEARRHPANTSG